MKKAQIILFFLNLFIVGNACNNPNSDIQVSDEPIDPTEIIMEEQGTPEYLDLKVDAFRQKLESTENAIVIDVRTAAEIAEGKITGALEMDFYKDDFQNQILELDKNKSYFMYCRSGNRSGQASKFMTKNGFTQVYNLDGGYSAWIKE